jgi:hypothetical protein
MFNYVIKWWPSWMFSPHQNVYFLYEQPIKDFIQRLKLYHLKFFFTFDYKVLMTYKTVHCGDGHVG